MADDVTVRLGFRSRVSAGLVHLGEIRDGLLVLGALLYGFGYATWALIATQSGLGPIPTFEFQYFVAGVPPLVILTGIWAFARAVRPMTRRWVESSSPRAPARAILAVVVAMPSMLVITIFLVGHRTASVISLMLITIVGVFGTTLLTFRLEEIEARSPFTKGLLSPKLAVRLNLATLAIAAILCARIYVFEIYPSIPQTLGGALPRCAQLDVTDSLLSGETKKVLGIERTEEVGIARTARLGVVFAGKEFLVLQVKPYGPLPRNYVPPILEIRREAVTVIDWCD